MTPPANSSSSGAMAADTELVNALPRAVDNEIARTGDVVTAIDKFFAPLPIQRRKTLVRLKEESLRLKEENLRLKRERENAEKENLRPKIELVLGSGVTKEDILREIRSNWAEIKAL